MKVPFRITLGLGLATLLSACGGDNVQIDTPKLASSAQAASVQAVSANMPQPDCAADGCKGLRIIDANAEVFRYEAMQRAGAPQS